MIDFNDKISHRATHISKDMIRVREHLSIHNIMCAADLETYFDLVIDCLVMQLTAYVARGEHEQIGFIQIPSTWFEHFKEAHFPAWALKRWSVVYRDIPYTKTIRICPHANVAWGDCRHIEFLSREIRDGEP